MIACVIGYGSIGSRHARILRQYGMEVVVVSKRSNNEFECFPDIDSAANAKNIDYIVVANSTDEHLDALTEISRLGFKGDVLVEKPLFSTFSEFAAPGFRSLHVAYNLRFHPLVQRLQQELDGETCLSALCYAGQYLPSWRPNTDYTTSYSTSKSKGGGVLRDLSHELDYVSLLFGPWQSVQAIGGHYSSLHGDSDDVFALALSMQNCPVVQVQMNYLDRPGRRFLLVNTDRRTLEIDFNKGVFRIDGAETKLDVDRDVTYREMHRAILEGFSGACTLAEGMGTLRLIEAAEHSAQGGGTRWQH